MEIHLHERVVQQGLSRGPRVSIRNEDNVQEILKFWGEELALWGVQQGRVWSFQVSFVIQVPDLKQQGNVPGVMMRFQIAPGGHAGQQLQDRAAQCPDIASRAVHPLHSLWRQVRDGAHDARGLQRRIKAVAVTDVVAKDM